MKFNNESSDSDVEFNYTTNKTMTLRRRLPQSNNINQDEEPEYTISSTRRSTRVRRQKIKPEEKQYLIDLDIELDQQDEVIKQKDEIYNGIFCPDIDKIIWQKPSEADSLEFKYLIKYKGVSYKHVEWVDFDTIMLTKTGKNKLNRFKRTFQQKRQQAMFDESTDNPQNLFDPSYIKVDRILSTTDIFPVIHPKQAMKMQGKWLDILLKVVQTLLNFDKEGINYGIYFSQPVNEERDGAADYNEIITNPMDFGTIANRLYLQIYQTPQEFWQELGLVFKNCSYYNKDENSEIRILSDTLREVAIHLYRQWHEKATIKYDQLQEALENKTLTPDFDGKISEEVENIKTSIEKEVQGTITHLQDTLQKFNEIQLPKEVKNSHKDATEFKMKKFMADNIKIFKGVNQQLNLGTIMSQQQKSVVDYFKNKTAIGRMSKIAPSTHTMFFQVIGKLFDGKLSHLAQFQTLTNNNNNKNQQNPYSIECSTKPTYDSSIEYEYLKKKIEKFNPGPFQFDWLQEDGKEAVNHEEYQYFSKEELNMIDLDDDVDTMYKVKWINQSYLDATWEHLSDIKDEEEKIQIFREWNKSLDKGSRNLAEIQGKRFRWIHDYTMNVRRNKLTSNNIKDLIVRFFYHDIAFKKKPIKYTVQTQPIFKGQRMLRYYQLESLNWMIDAFYKKKNIILADEMGLGKTIQSISLLYHLYNFENYKGPFLVIAPLSTLAFWKRSVEEWTNLNAVLYYDSKSLKGRKSCRSYEWNYLDITKQGHAQVCHSLFKFQILITSFEVFHQDADEVLSFVPFQYIVIDEAHKLKNQNAKHLKSLRKLPCKRILLLTGTPVQNNTEELWSLLNFIEPTKFPFKDYLSNEYQEMTESKLEDLKALIKPYILRRKKEEVEESIPPLSETIIDVEMTNVQKKIYRALYEKNKHILSQNFNNVKFTSSLNNLEMQLRKCCNHPFMIKEIEDDLTKDCKTYAERCNIMVESSGKMILLDKLLPKMKREGKKCLIFSQFTYILTLLEQYMMMKGYKFEKIQGSVSNKDRQNAIDRFNDPKKQRDFFLLSTKAGGLGINLTSAKIVIIYDSDWNPQNDVQATARAHRIGQEDEVMVYRLITNNTYEAEMFQRASKKLGLDQAIFIDGSFAKTKFSIGSKEKTMKIGGRVISKQDIEILLKKGIIGLIKDSGKKSDDFKADDIENILKKNSRMANYSVLSNVYSFSKKFFVAENCDTDIDMNDPNFWKKVFKDSKTESKLLLDQVMNDKDLLYDASSQKAFMIKLNKAVNLLISNKVNIRHYNADDEKNLRDILNKIINSNQFHKQYKEFCWTWLDEIQRPSRRYKPLKEDNFDIGTNRQKRYDNHEQEGGKDEIMDIEDSDEEIRNALQDDDDYRITTRKLTDKQMSDLHKQLCCYCERPQCSYFCAKHCKRSFHEKCKDIVESGVVCGLDANEIDFEVKELQKDYETTEYNINYTCVSCKKREAICKVCQKQGLFIPKDHSKRRARKQKQVDKMENDPFSFLEEGDLIKCSTANCNKFYHPKCIQGNKFFKYYDSNKHRKFRCSLHYCYVCGISGDTMTLFQCFRCYKAYHSRCLQKEKIIRLTKKLIICEEHNLEARIKARQEKEVSDKAARQLRAKTKKRERAKLRSQDRKAKKKLEKEKNEAIQHKKKQKNLLEMFELQKQKEFKRMEIEIVINNKVLNKNLVALVKRKKDPLIQQKMVISDSKKFDYANVLWRKVFKQFHKRTMHVLYHTRQPRTLCTIHYMNWNSSKILDLSAYKDLPTSPINPEANTEHAYLKRMREKHGETFDPQSCLLKKKRSRSKPRNQVKLVKKANGEVNEVNRGQEEEVNGILAVVDGIGKEEKENGDSYE